MRIRRQQHLSGETLPSGSDGDYDFAGSSGDRESSGAESARKRKIPPDGRGGHGIQQEQNVLGNCRKKWIRVCSLPESVPCDEGGVRLGQVCLRTDCREKNLACARCGWNAEAQPVEGVVC